MSEETQEHTKQGTQEKSVDIIQRISHWSSTFGLPMLKEEGFPSQERIDLSMKLI